MATSIIEVSWCEPRGCWRKYIGQQIGRDGSLKPKCWYFGVDHREAIRRALELTAEWNRLRRAGANAWPLKRKLGSRPVNEKDDFVDPSDLTVGQVADLYVASIQRKAEAGQRSWSYVHSVRTRMGWIFEALGRHTRILEIGEKEIEDAVMFLVRRPRAKRRMHQKPPSKPISVVLVVHSIRQMKSLLTWAYELDGCSWQRPKRFDRIFRIRTRDMATQEERARAARQVVSGDVASFTIEELQILWRAARERDRLFILLGLNCGFTSSEISDLRTFEIFLDAQQPYIHRRRNKTGVEARWSLWPETANALLRHQAPENPELRWLLTNYGNPLVEVTPTTRRDAIEQAWKSLVERSEVERRLGFRFLRKTGADAIKRLGGLDLSEMFLSHQEPGLNKHYANRDWPKLWTCLQELRDQMPFLQDRSFTSQDASKPESSPAFARRPTKRSRTGRLNVSFHEGKKRYYGRVYKSGRTYCTKYFPTAEEAASAAATLRLELPYRGER